MTQVLKSKCRGVKTSTKKQKKEDNSTQPEKKTRVPGARKEVFPFLVSSVENAIDIAIPAKTVSEANNFEHWTKKDRRHKNQKKWVNLAFLQCKCQLPCIVKMTRHAPGFLDEEDNLRIALKWIKDQVAANLTGDFLPGRADGNKGIKWEYDQVKSKTYGVKIRITQLSSFADHLESCSTP